MVAATETITDFCNFTKIEKQERG